MSSAAEKAVQSKEDEKYLHSQYLDVLAIEAFVLIFTICV